MQEQKNMKNSCLVNMLGSVTHSPLAPAYINKYDYTGWLEIYLHSEHWCNHLLCLCWMCLYLTRRNDSDRGCYVFITQDLRARCAPRWSQTEEGKRAKLKKTAFLRCLLSGWQRAQYPGAFKATFSSNGYLTSSAINRRHGDSGGC